MKKKLIILSSVILMLTVNINAEHISKQFGDNVNTTCIVAMEKENELKIEDWMIDSNIWATFNCNLSNIDKDSELVLEDWMFNDTIWN